MSWVLPMCFDIEYFQSILWFIYIWSYCILVYCLSQNCSHFSFKKIVGYQCFSIRLKKKRLWSLFCIVGTVLWGRVEFLEDFLDFEEIFTYTKLRIGRFGGNSRTIYQRFIVPRRRVSIINRPKFAWICPLTFLSNQFKLI